MAEHDIQRQRNRTVLTAKESSVRVHQISNGWVVSETRTDAKGNFKETETFSRLKPKIEVTG